jgi:two-component system cell cycle response regulator DivK
MIRSRILLVDDNELNLELITDVLEGAGYHVQLARTGEEALAAARTDAPDLILMDIGLPGMDGYSAVKQLKADPRTRGIPTVAVTAFAMAGDAERATTSGFDGYITKPIATRTLPETVARMLRGKDGR